MKKHLLTLLCLLCLGLPALAAEEVLVAFIADGASYSGSASKTDQIIIKNNTSNNIVNETFTADNLCSIKLEKKNNSSSKVDTKLVRWYANDLMHFTPASGVKITKVVINASEKKYASALGKTCSVGEMTYNTNDTFVTWTGESEKDFTIKAEGQCRFASIEITCKKNKTPIDPSKTEVALAWSETAKESYNTGESAEFTLTVDPIAAANSVVVTSSDENAVKVSALGDGKYKADFLAAANNVAITASIPSSDETYTATPASLNFNVAKAYTNVPDFYTIGKNNSGILSFPLTVTYQDKNKNYTYAQDNEGNATLVYNSSNSKVTVPEYVAGDVIAAGWTGKYSPYNGLDEIVVVSGLQEAATHNDITIPVVTSVSKDDMNKIVIIENVEFTASTPSDKSAFEGTVGETTYKFFNQLSTASVEKGTYNVKAAVAYYQSGNGAGYVQLFPIEYIEKPKPDVPVFVVADEDWYDKATRTVYKGAKVTLTAPENVGEDWVMAYTVDDAEEKLTDAPVVLTIEKETTISAYFDEANVVTWTFNVAKLPELTINPAFGAVVEDTKVTVNCEVEGAKLTGNIGDVELNDVALPYTFTVNDEIEVYIQASHQRYLSSETLEGTYTIKLAPIQGVWEPVTSIDQIKDGDIVTFMAKEYTGKASGQNVTYPEVVMGAMGKDVIAVAEITEENGIFPAETMEFVINNGTETGKYTFLNENGYLYATTKNNVNWSADAKELKLSINESTGAATVGGFTVMDGTKVLNVSLRYNANIKNPVDITSARFAFYSTGQQDVYMYRQIESGLAMPACEVPAVDKIEVGHKINIKCAKGAHLWIRESELEGPAAARKRVIETSSDWTNYGTHNVEYEVTSLGRQIEVKAVTPDGRKQSKTLVFELSRDGVITGVNGIEVDNEQGAVRYFNLQGVEVSNPANGIFIRVANGRSSKVAL